MNMEPKLDLHISGTERCRALKIKTPKEKFITVRTTNIKSYCNIFNTYRHTNIGKIICMALRLVFNQVVLTEGNEIHLVSTVFILQTFLLKKKRKKHFIFAK